MKKKPSAIQPISREIFDCDVPYLKSFFPPSEDDGAGLRQALRDPVERVLIKAYATDYQDVDCILLLTNRRVVLARIKQLSAVLAFKVVKSLIGKVPILGDAVLGVIKIGQIAWNAATSAEKKLAEKVAALDENAIIAGTGAVPPVIDMRYQDILNDFSSIHIAKKFFGKGHILLVPPFSWKKRSRWTKGAIIYLPSEKHFATYRAYVQVFRDDFAAHNIGVEMNDSSAEITFPSA